MKTVTHRSTENLRAPTSPQPYPPLELETRSVVDSKVVAFHLGRQPQTVRGWASSGEGPLRPIRINGRLAWKTSDLRKLLGVA